MTPHTCNIMTTPLGTSRGLSFFFFLIIVFYYLVYVFIFNMHFFLLFAYMLEFLYILFMHCIILPHVSPVLIFESTHRLLSSVGD